MAKEIYNGCTETDYDQISQITASYAVIDARAGAVDGSRYSAGEAIQVGEPMVRHGVRLLLDALLEQGHIVGDVNPERLRKSIMRLSEQARGEV